MPRGKVQQRKELLDNMQEINEQNPPCLCLYLESSFEENYFFKLVLLLAKVCLWLTSVQEERWGVREGTLTEKEKGKGETKAEKSNQSPESLLEGWWIQTAHLGCYILKTSNHVEQGNNWERWERNTLGHGKSTIKLSWCKSNAFSWRSFSANGEIIQGKCGPNSENVICHFFSFSNESISAILIFVLTSVCTK